MPAALADSTSLSVFIGAYTFVFIGAFGFTGWCSRTEGARVSRMRGVAGKRKGGAGTNMGGAGMNRGPGGAGVGLECRNMNGQIPNHGDS